MLTKVVWSTNTADDGRTAGLTLQNARTSPNTGLISTRALEKIVRASHVPLLVAGCRWRSLRRRDAELLCSNRDPHVLPLHRRGELGRPAEIGDLPGQVQAVLDHRIHGPPNIRGNALANSAGHARVAEEADQAVERKLGIAG